jgi:hypothetical protein
MFMTCYAGDGTPNVLRNWNIAMFLEAGEVDFIQWCCHGLDVCG